MTTLNREEIIRAMAISSKEATIKCYTSTAEPFDPNFADSVHIRTSEAALDALIGILPSSIPNKEKRPKTYLSGLYIQLLALKRE